MTTTTRSTLVSAGIAAATAGFGAVLVHGGGVSAARAAMSSGEASTLHAGLFFATVWIVSSLRINRLRAFWRVGFRPKVMRGASGSLLPRGPKARAAAGGSVRGAGTSGQA